MVCQMPHIHIRDKFKAQHTSLDDWHILQEHKRREDGGIFRVLGSEEGREIW